ncbi:MAG: glycosyltransferase family 1 protein [Chryseolinea sp.]
MPRFAKMLSSGMRARGHTVETWSPDPYFHKLTRSALPQKWLGYLDQYLIFPRHIKRRIAKLSSDTLFVLTDQALGMWVPSLAHRHHVIHCHDFLALRSALNEIPENKTSSTGKLYQRLILRGLQKGLNFICVSENTRKDLLRFVENKSVNAKVVYNGFHQQFSPTNKDLARTKLEQLFKLSLKAGYLLHIGGNLWYKNRPGIIEIYDAWRKKGSKALPLIMIGEEPDASLKQRHSNSPFSKDIHWFTGISDDAIRLAYAGASIFMFPSLGEGFGWPIAEAMASGTPVITTDEAPMTEVAGNAGFLIPRMPKEADAIAKWNSSAADVVEKIISLSPEGSAQVVAKGIENSKRFETQHALDEIEEIYKQIIAHKLS